MTSALWSRGLAFGALALAATAGATLGVVGPAAVVAALGLGLVLLVVTRRGSGLVIAPARVDEVEIADEATLLTLSDGWARNAFFFAVLVRVVLAIFLNSTGYSRDLAPDSWGYERFGAIIAASWENPLVDPAMIRGYKPYSAYQNLNGLVTYLTGFRSAPIVSLINAFIAPWGAWVLGVISGRLAGREAQKRTFLLASFFPSLILWSSINLRDCWNWLLVAQVLLATMNLRERFSTRNLLILGLCLAILPLIRSYMLLLVGTGIGLSFLLVRVRSLPVAAVALVIVVGLMVNLGERFGMEVVVDLDERLETLNKMKWGMSGGRAGYHRGVDISTPQGALSYLPLGTSIFLFAPFPWSPTNLRQAMAVPETLIWYGFFAQAVRGLWNGRRALIVRAAPVFFTALVTTLSYGLVEGNEGTAYRHRSQVMLLLFVFAGIEHARRFAARRGTSSTHAGLGP